MGLIWHAEYILNEYDAWYGGHQTSQGHHVNTNRNDRQKNMAMAPGL